MKFNNFNDIRYFHRSIENFVLDISILSLYMELAYYKYPLCLSLLTHFSPVSHFCTPWKRQKTFGFLTFSGGIEIWHWTKMG